MTTPAVRNRIKAHKTVRAGDLVPHELNPRVHNDVQRRALADLYSEIGFARSLLAYELPDGRLKLIDGHLRASQDPDQLVEVEILDVNDEEARKLLLSIDPLAQLASFDRSALLQLQEITSTASETLSTLWASLSEAQEGTQQALERAQKVSTTPKSSSQPVRFLVEVECANETEQLKLLRRFRKEGLSCSARMK